MSSTRQTLGKKRKKERKNRTEENIMKLERASLYCEHIGGGTTISPIHPSLRNKRKKEQKWRKCHEIRTEQSARRHSILWAESIMSSTRPSLGKKGKEKKQKKERKTGRKKEHLFIEG